MRRYKVSWLITSICSELQTVYSELILTLIFSFLKGSLSTALPSDVEPEAEARSPEQRDRDIEEVKRALDELHRLPSTDL